MAMIKVFESERVTVGSAAYHSAKLQAQRIAATYRQRGKGGHDRWEDDYNDHSATGRFVVTART